MDNATSKIIGNRINTLLAKKNIMQKQLAEYLEVTDNTISYFVKGKRTPNTEQIIKIAKFFDVSSDYLLGLTNAETSDKGVQFICDYTYLNNSSINVLHNWHSTNVIKVLNYFLNGSEHIDFRHFANENTLSANGTKKTSKILANEQGGCYPVNLFIYD